MDDDGWKAVKPIVAQRAMTYAVMTDNKRISEQYGGIDSLPTSFFIEREGKIASTHFGPVSKRNCEAEILKLINRSRFRRTRMELDIASTNNRFEEGLVPALHIPNSLSSLLEVLSTGSATWLIIVS